jgi:hypothetical protein
MPELPLHNTQPDRPRAARTDGRPRGLRTGPGDDVTGRRDLIAAFRASGCPELRRLAQLAARGFEPPGGLQVVGNRARRATSQFSQSGPQETADVDVAPRQHGRQARPTTCGCVEAAEMRPEMLTGLGAFPTLRALLTTTRLSGQTTGGSSMRTDPVLWTCRVMLLGILGTSLTTLTAQAQRHSATRLGDPETRFAPPLRTPDDLRALFANEALKPDILFILRKAKWPGDPHDLWRAASTAAVHEVFCPRRGSLTCRRGRRANRSPGTCSGPARSRRGIRIQLRLQRHAVSRRDPQACCALGRGTRSRPAAFVARPALADQIHRPRPVSTNRRGHLVVETPATCRSAGA